MKRLWHRLFGHPAFKKGQLQAYSMGIELVYAEVLCDCGDWRECEIVPTTWTV